MTRAAAGRCALSGFRGWWWVMVVMSRCLPGALSLRFPVVVGRTQQGKGCVWCVEDEQCEVQEQVRFGPWHRCVDGKWSLAVPWFDLPRRVNEWRGGCACDVTGCAMQNFPLPMASCGSVLVLSSAAVFFARAPLNIVFELRCDLWCGSEAGPLCPTPVVSAPFFCAWPVRFLGERFVTCVLVIRILYP